MDFLVLSCGTGGGHDAAAQTLAGTMTLRGHRAVILNPYTLHSFQLAGKIDRAYVNLVQKAPSVFGAVYAAGELYRRLPFRSPVYFANRLMGGILGEYLEENRFDAVITTHLFPAEMLTGMRDKGMPTPPVVYVATDYVCLPFTEKTGCDAYVIPSAGLIDEFAGCGLPRGKIYPLGIPVSSAFSRGESREEARVRLGLDLDKKYILVSGGSMGGGRIKAAVQTLSEAVVNREDTELIVVCGSNEQLYGELTERGVAGLTAIGFTGEMAGYMRAANLFVTKPGGLSSTEAAVCGVPLVHTAEIPGCETFNARYFSSCGMSLSCAPTPEGLLPALDLLDDMRAREAMLQKQREIVNPDAAEQICSLAERLADAGCGEAAPAWACVS